MTGIVGWQPIALRLFLTLLAGFLIGFNRGEHGRPAGMRTTMLVCLAASISMMQANLLLGTAGRASDSYVILDLMRLPLGILTGVGFIGAGAIFRRDDLVIGVTTAATLWFVTVIGLCLGGGQIGLGMVGTLLGLAVLWGLKIVELRVPQEKTALLTVTASLDGPSVSDVRTRLDRARIRIIKLSEAFSTGEDGRRMMRFDVRWLGLRQDATVPAAVDELAKADGVLFLKWKP
jgi:putative Mg2+ transporter-C (MgtC) family protein